MNENRNTDLIRLGWNDGFEAQAECGPGESLARVVAVDRDLLLVMDQIGSFRAKLAGSYLYRNRVAQEFPCVGDWVCVEKDTADKVARIHRLLERRTTLRRKAAGDTVDYQMIAANVDYVLIVQSCLYDFSPKRLGRYLVMVEDGGAEPCILLTKTDLVEPEILESQLMELRNAGVTAPVLTVSNVTRKGVDELERSLQPAKTYCFVGSSGVGKSTLINHLLGHEMLPTNEVSETGEGQHTTVRRELIILESGALVIDNPGMREFGIFGTENAIEGSFSDITDLASGCRFSDCKHSNEPGCAVREAVGSGTISQVHYDHYLKLREESSFNQMSYLDKRKKDRTFGKFIKSVKKTLNG